MCLHTTRTILKVLLQNYACPLSITGASKVGAQNGYIYVFSGNSLGNNISLLIYAQEN
jgi:hypothetical protein